MSETIMITGTSPYKTLSSTPCKTTSSNDQIIGFVEIETHDGFSSALFEIEIQQGAKNYRVSEDDWQIGKVNLH